MRALIVSGGAAVWCGVVGILTATRTFNGNKTLAKQQKNILIAKEKMNGVREREKRVIITKLS